MRIVTIGDQALTIEELLEVARGARVELDPEVGARIATSRGVVEAVLAGGEPVYGLNTGVGHMKDVRLPEEDLRRNQEMLLITHASGIGDPLRPELVRAAMVVRLTGIARGGSGASPAIAQILAQMLNEGIPPVMPEGGSVGAGDLGQLASVGLVAIGRGAAEHRGEVVPGAVALERAGILPIELEPKDGLTIMSANGVSVGHGALVVSRSELTAEGADVAVALSLEAIRGDPSIALPVVAAAKPFPGQIASCRAITAALGGSDRMRPGEAGSVQDPLSFRVAPQVHGAFREAASYARRAVEIELNGRNDNPLVSVEDGRMIHNGNFHPIVMAIAFDQLRVAIAHVGQISERRMSHLWDAVFAQMEGLGPLAASAEPPPMYGLSLRYSAAALVAELKQLASPSTLDVPPLDIGIEDHATNAPLAVRKTEEALAMLEGLLAIEMLLARDVLGVGGPVPALGAGTGAAVARIEGAIAALGGDRSTADVHRAVRNSLFADEGRDP